MDNQCPFCANRIVCHHNPLLICYRTSDEHISIAQFLKASNVDGAIIVTTPQEVSIIDVRKEINFCKKV